MNPTPQVSVAVFMTSFDAGGTERQMTELLRRLDPNRFKVHAVCFHSEGAWLSRVRERAASIMEFPISGFARLKTLRQLVRFAAWCRQERITVIQTCDFYSNVFGLAGAWLAGVPVRIGSRRELNPDKTEAQIRLQRFAYRYASKVVANSGAAAEILRGEGLPASAVVVVPNGLDARAYGEAAPRNTCHRVITVANLRPEKSHETLIVAAAMLATSCPHLRYQIVGDGARRRELEALARAQGVERIMEFVGHREDVPALLASSDVFVLPSRSEACPNGVLEAMAAGLPVVASAVGGLLELIESGRTGVLVPPSDPEPLARALKALYDDPGGAAAIGASARREVLARYSFERMVAGFTDLYASQLHKCDLWRRETAQAGI